jgi:hypothetical protein
MPALKSTQFRPVSGRVLVYPGGEVMSWPRIQRLPLFERLDGWFVTMGVAG